MSEWIKYSERKPEKSGRYFVMGTFGEVAIMNYFRESSEMMGGDRYFRAPGFYYFVPAYDIYNMYYGIKWWMPIPELPKDKEET